MDSLTLTVISFKKIGIWMKKDLSDQKTIHLKAKETCFWLTVIISFLGIH